ncbi:hypothetical protein OH76DRAFT_1490747 [Lentinus brumalis]|uniref:Uncharacterized protein n=1 Tax=Lentinus brumalis TaxID=2498619 RepID=A0A371CI04_9APHY|nr:hypothetical protein OH76DRAFT_1490747 [Polyporus brumalis]
MTQPRTTPLQLWYTAPCDLVFRFGTVGAESRASDFARKQLQIFLVGVDVSDTLLFCVFEEQKNLEENRMEIIPVEISREFLESMVLLSGQTGLFLVFPFNEVRIEFTDAIEAWFRDRQHDRAAVAPEPVDEGPTICGVGVLTIASFLRESRAAIEDYKAREDIECMSGAGRDFGLDG